MKQLTNKALSTSLAEPQANERKEKKTQQKPIISGNIDEKEKNNRDKCICVGCLVKRYLHQFSNNDTRYNYIFSFIILFVTMRWILSHRFISLFNWIGGRFYWRRHTEMFAFQLYIACIGCLSLALCSTCANEPKCISFLSQKDCRKNEYLELGPPEFGCCPRCTKGMGSLSITNSH